MENRPRSRDPRFSRSPPGRRQSRRSDRLARIAPHLFHSTVHLRISSHKRQKIKLSKNRQWVSVSARINLSTPLGQRFQKLNSQKAPLRVHFLSSPPHPPLVLHSDSGLR